MNTTTRASSLGAGCGRVLRRAAYRVLAVAVRGRRERGGPWGEAVLAEFPMTSGGWEAARWSAGGLRTALRERLAAVPGRRMTAYRYVAAVIAAVLVAAGVHQFVFAVHYIPSASMAPTLQVGDRIVVDEFSFHLTGIDRGDIVTFTVPRGWAPNPATGTFVKRVVGLPGDTVGCQGGRLVRNGSLVDEPYLPGNLRGMPVGDCPTTIVADGHLYVLGDAHDVSMDSRQLGTIPASAVTGRLIFHT